MASSQGHAAVFPERSRAAINHRYSAPVLVASEQLHRQHRRSIVGLLHDTVHPPLSLSSGQTASQPNIDEAHATLLELSETSNCRLRNDIRDALEEWRVNHYLTADTSYSPWQNHVPKLLLEMAELREQNEQLQFSLKAISTGTSLVFMYSELISDILVIRQLLDQGTMWAYVAIGLLAWAQVAMGVASLVLRQSWAITLGSLVGLKPAIDAYMDLMSITPRKGQMVDNHHMLLITRKIQLAFAAIPQGLVQTIVYLMMDSSNRTWLQLVSITLSCVDIGFEAAATDHAFDASRRYQIQEPLLFPIFPVQGACQFATMVGSSVAFACFALSKFIAIGMLARASRAAPAAWLASECLMLLAVRVCLRNWRFYVRGLDDILTGLLSHLLYYCIIMAAPLLIFRLPLTLTPRVYFGYVCWTLFVANPLMSFVGYIVGGGIPGVSIAQVACGLALITFCSILGGLFAYAYMNPQRRRTIFEHNTCTMHMQSFWWNAATVTNFNGALVSGNQDLVRATCLSFYATRYLPRDQVAEWLSGRWAEWSEMTHPPDFFDETWIASIPQGLLQVAAPMSPQMENCDHFDHIPGQALVNE